MNPIHRMWNAGVARYSMGTAVKIPRADFLSVTSASCVPSSSLRACAVGAQGLQSVRVGRTGGAWAPPPEMKRLSHSAARQAGTSLTQLTFSSNATAPKILYLRESHRPNCPTCTFHGTVKMCGHGPHRNSLFQNRKNETQDCSFIHGTT